MRARTTVIIQTKRFHPRAAKKLGTLLPYPLSGPLLLSSPSWSLRRSWSGSRRRAAALGFPNEARYMLLARATPLTAARRSSPIYGGEQYLNKPQLFFWSVAVRVPSRRRR